MRARGAPRQPRPAPAPRRGAPAPPAAHPARRRSRARCASALCGCAQHILDGDPTARRRCRDTAAASRPCSASSRRTAGLSGAASRPGTRRAARMPRAAAGRAIRTAAALSAAAAGVTHRRARRRSGGRPRLRAARAAPRVRSPPARASGSRAAPRQPGDATSTVTLSVSISMSGSFSSTLSPTCFSHRRICERVPSVCSAGALISTACSWRSAHRLARR